VKRISKWPTDRPSDTTVIFAFSCPAFSSPALIFACSRLELIRHSSCTEAQPRHRRRRRRCWLQCRCSRKLCQVTLIGTVQVRPGVPGRQVSQPSRMVQVEAGAPRRRRCAQCWRRRHWTSVERWAPRTSTASLSRTYRRQPLCTAPSVSRN